MGVRLRLIATNRFAMPDDAAPGTDEICDLNPFLIGVALAGACLALQQRAAARELVRHLVASQVDNPDHIHMISPLTQSYELLFQAAESMFGRPRADIERSVRDQREAIKKYRPLVAEVVRQRDDAARYRRALNEIAYDHPSDPERVARRALGDDTTEGG